MSKPTPSSPSSESSVSSPLSESSDSTCVGAAHKPPIFPKDPREMQSYLMTLDEIDIHADEEQTELFTRYTIDAVCASYAAARHRVRQYTQLAKLYQREADDWAVKIEKAAFVMPDYKPAWLTSCLG